MNRDGGLNSPGSELAMSGGKKGRAPHSPFGSGGGTLQADRSWKTRSKQQMVKKSVNGY